MFYTSVVKMGSNIIHRYIKDGKRHQDVIKNFEYDLYLRSEYSRDALDVHKNHSKRYVFDNIYDMNQFVIENGNENVYGNTDPVSQFIAKTYPDEIKLTNDYVVLNFDIETEHGEGFITYKDDYVIKVQETNKEPVKMTLGEFRKIDLNKYEYHVYDEERFDWMPFEKTCYAPKQLGFPDPNLALYQVMSVSLISSLENIIYVFGTKDFKGSRIIDGSEYTIQHIYCHNEKELLIRFIQKWREIKPDILTGWNVEGFDVPYIINRIVRVLGKKFANMLSPFSSESNNCIRERQKEEAVYYSIAGITIYDYLSVYKKFSREKQESYKLDWIGKVEVGHQKISYEEYDNSLMKLWEYDYDKFILYNAIDTLIVNKLDKKLKFINLAITIAHITKSDLSDALGTIKIWDNMIYNLLRRRDIQIPPNIKQEKSKEFLGAFVKDPLLGRHGWTLTFDLTSLYPSIIRMLGMSPETLVDREVGNDLSANAEIRTAIQRNIMTVSDIIEGNQYGTETALEYDIELTSTFTANIINDLKSLDKVSLSTILNQLRKADDYFNSGHNHIYGVKTVLDNVAEFIDMNTDLSWAKEKNVTVAGNGSTYDKSTEGVIPEAMTYLFNYRKTLKNKMKEEKKLLQKKIEELHRLEAQINS